MLDQLEKAQDGLLEKFVERCDRALEDGSFVTLAINWHQLTSKGSLRMASIKAGPYDPFVIIAKLFVVGETIGCLRRDGQNTEICTRAFLDGISVFIPIPGDPLGIVMQTFADMFQCAADVFNDAADGINGSYVKGPNSCGISHD